MSTKAIGIVRVSQLGDRDRETFSSPQDQCDRMRELADAQGWNLTIPEPHEINVSGDALLEDRPQLSRAVMAVQTGAADVIVAAHTERLWWNHEVRGQVLRLVETAGGEVWSADEGKLSNGSAAQEFSGTVRTAADRLSRKQNAEKSAKGVRRLIAEGRCPWAKVPVGYLRGDDDRLVRDPATAGAVVRAFRLRAEGATFKTIRADLAAHGVHRTVGGVQQMLAHTVYLGEIRFGTYPPNRMAHEPIVPADLFAAVQRIRTPRGPRPRSERLLSGVGVLRCASCGGRMSISKANASYFMYRCAPHGDCSRRVTISADLVEGIVVDAVRVALADVEGRASDAQRARSAVDAAEAAQAQLDALIDLLDPLEPAARRRLVAATERRDEAREQAERLSGASGAVVVRGWDDRLTLEERRALIRAVVDRVDVSPGRGADRVTVHLLGE